MTFGVMFHHFHDHFHKRGQGSISKNEFINIISFLKKKYILNNADVYIEKILKKEIKYFEEKFKIKINFFAGPQLIIPEYSISLIDKNKKLLNKVENLSKIEGLIEAVDEDKFEETKKKPKNTKNTKNTKDTKDTKDKIKKKSLKKEKIKKNKKSPRTLWVRRKKKAA
jgi:hypothetical protein